MWSVLRKFWKLLLWTIWTIRKIAIFTVLIFLPTALSKIWKKLITLDYQFMEKLNLVDLWNLAKICAQIFCNFFALKFCSRKFGKNSQMFGMKKSCIHFFTFPISFAKNAKNQIRKICHYSSNMADMGLKIWQKLFQVKVKSLKKTNSVKDTNFS